MGTKDNPAPFDCYANAEPDEPMFVILARDPTASLVVDYWIGLRVEYGKNRPDDPQILEARECSDAMRAWWMEHRYQPQPTWHGAVGEDGDPMAGDGTIHDGPVLACPVCLPRLNRRYPVSEA